MSKTEFKACEHLQFEEEFIGCQKQMLADGKAFWLRDVEPDLPRMVQFCALRGRLNHPMACLRERDAVCHLYREKVHIVEVDQ